MGTKTSTNFGTMRSAIINDVIIIIQSQVINGNVGGNIALITLSPKNWTVD
jgi:hypothetical protein